MKLNAPKKNTLWIALALVVIGIIAQFIAIPVLSTFAFWLVVVSAVLLLVATYIPNL
ncbi:MAG: hypothetical protein JXA42_25175 [Anaerolineales bacterium]|nr:hypothetical protein [Anaerolineales bacterium]